MLRTFKNELETNKRLSPKEMWGLHATLRAYQVPCVTNLIDKWYIHRYIDIFYIGLSYLSHAIRFRTLPALEAQHWWMWNQCQNSCMSPQSHHAWAARSSSEASWGKNLINQNLALYTAEVDRQNPAPVSHLYNGIRFRSAGYIDPSPLWHLFRLGWTIHQLVQDFVRMLWEWMHWALLAQAHFVFHHYSRPHPRSHHPQQLPPFAPAQSWTLAKWIGGLNHLKSSYYVNRPCSEPRA